MTSRTWTVWLSAEIVKASVLINKANIKSRSYLIPSSGPIKKTYCRGLLLIGDTGGFVNPLTGAGILPGMQTGKFAAQVAHSSLDLGDNSPKILQGYDNQWKKVMGRRMKRHYIMQRLGLAIKNNPVFQILAYQDKENRRD